VFDSGVIKTDLVIIGAGMAGMAAALFAANRGIPAVHVGGPGQLVHASGAWDLLGVHPIAESKNWREPWNGIRQLVQDIPDHPYARISGTDMHSAFEELLDAFSKGGLPYCRNKEQNCELFTSVGTRKQTYCVPKTFWNGVAAWQNRRSCLLIDFEGLKDFSAKQIVATLGEKWPGLRSMRIALPNGNHAGELFPEYVARYLDSPTLWDGIVSQIGPHLAAAESIGFPAVMGFHSNLEIMTRLEDSLGVPIFEIPTTPVSVPGLRMRKLFSEQLKQKKVSSFLDKLVLSVESNRDGGFLLSLGTATRPERAILAKGIILATGRFFGKGLCADRRGIRETLFDLPVSQPNGRAGWHREEMLDVRGHPVNMAGLEVDPEFRPLDKSREPAFRTLFAVGSILAHQDWVRMKCGSGLAVATAYAAVSNFVKHMN